MIELAFKTKPMAWSVKIGRNGRAYISPAYRKWKETIAWEAKAQIKRHPEWKDQIPNRVGFRLFTFFRPGQRSDGTNRHKAIEDALKGICYTDDRLALQGCWKDMPEGWTVIFGSDEKTQIVVRIYPP